VTRELVLGVGNPICGDDGAGPALVARLRRKAPPGADVAESDGEISGLLAALEGRERVILVDAARGGRRPGAIARFEDGDHDPLASVRLGSTHALGLAEALMLGRALGRRPAQVIVYAIEGRSFRPGDGLSPEVERAVRRVERLVRAELQDHHPPSTSSAPRAVTGMSHGHGSTTGLTRP
jgi:hydrogenase maturation protease